MSFLRTIFFISSTIAAVLIGVNNAKEIMKEIKEEIKKEERNK